MTDFETGFYANQAPININPFRAMAQAEQVRALTDDRRAQAEQRQQQTAALRRKAQQDAALDAMMQGAFVEDPNTGVSTFDRPTFERALVQGGQGHLYPAMAETLDKLDQSAAAFRKQQNTLYARTILAVQDHGNTPDAVTNAVAYLLKNGAMTKEHAQPILDAAAQDPSPEAIGALMTKLGSGLPEYAELTQTEQKRKADLAKTEAETRKANTLELNPGNVAVDLPSGKTIATAAPKDEHSPAWKELQDVNADRAARGLPPKNIEQYQNEDANRHRSIVNVNGGSANDVKDAVQGMMDGTNPPQMPGRASKEYTAILAEAKRRGYNLNVANLDWEVAKKHYSTLNGAQQTRIRQAVETAAQSLDVIDTLADKWDAGRFPVLNALTLKAAKGGAMGKDAQAIATQLDAQITDVTSELGNVYMGGNSPTDHALALAAKNLSANWSRDTLKIMTKQARTNLQIRANSIKNVSAIGPSADNPYAPAAAAPALVYDPKTGKFAKPGGGS